MIVWRLAPRRHVNSLDGAGNRDHGARWSSGRGRGVVYASLNVATCVLETFVHFGPALRARLPENLMLVRIQVPDDAGVLRIEADEIPADADLSGADRRTWYQRIGDAWLESGEALVLIAPSLVVPKEWNAMLNPAHPRMADVAIVASEPFRFDPRMATRARERRLPGTTTTPTRRRS
ncbi:MAG TPA: RES family NAD+ phosphorylase [Geminicoccaceae bacterium]|nr:RES family NAD+ phosphorylase [Geminicoccaceae bacterium]